MYIYSSYIECCDSIDLTLIFRANTVATAITVMRGNCQVEEHGGDHRDFEKLNAVGECFRQKTRELYCILRAYISHLSVHIR